MTIIHHDKYCGRGSKVRIKRRNDLMPPGTEEGFTDLDDWIFTRKSNWGRFVVVVDTQKEYKGWQGKTYAGKVKKCVAMVGSREKQKDNWHPAGEGLDWWESNSVWTINARRRWLKVLHKKCHGNHPSIQWRIYFQSPLRTEVIFYTK